MSEVQSCLRSTHSESTTASVMFVTESCRSGHIMARFGGRRFYAAIVGSFRLMASLLAQADPIKGPSFAKRLTCSGTRQTERETAASRPLFSARRTPGCTGSPHDGAHSPGGRLQRDK